VASTVCARVACASLSLVAQRCKEIVQGRPQQLDCVYDGVQPCIGCRKAVGLIEVLVRLAIEIPRVPGERAHPMKPVQTLTL
jgi:hypothetical protein